MSSTGATFTLTRSFIMRRPMDALPNELGSEVGGVLTEEMTSVEDTVVEARDEEEEEVDGELRIGETLTSGGTAAVSRTVVG